MKTLLTIIALSAATVFSAQAQETQKAAKPQTVKAQAQQTPADQAKAQTDRMTRDLSLSAEQSKKLMERNKTYYADVANMSKKDGSDANAMMTKTSDKYNADIKNILDAKQYEKYSSMGNSYMMDSKTKQMEAAPMNKEMERK